MLDYLSVEVTAKDDVDLNSMLQAFINDKHLFGDVDSSLFFLKQLIEELKRQTTELFISIAIEISNYQPALLSENPVENVQPGKNAAMLLSKREKEILTLVFQGLTNKQIAEKLFISFETVKSHRKHILTKTESKNTASLINKVDPAKFT